MGSVRLFNDLPLNLTLCLTFFFFSKSQTSDADPTRYEDYYSRCVMLVSIFVELCTLLYKMFGHQRTRQLLVLNLVVYG